MIVAFTGTRHGLTPPQQLELMHELRTYADHITELLHGDCTGADAMCDDFARELGIFRRVFPQDRVGLEHARANCAADVIEPADDDPIRRNRKMVDLCTVLIACPAQHSEQPRSGTWSTIRYARKLDRPGVVVLPDGVRRLL